MIEFMNMNLTLNEGHPVKVGYEPNACFKVAI